jgi:hypothetical protein
MPPSKSSKAKAAWDRARRYAEERGVSIKEARSTLARQKDAPKASKLPTKARSRSEPKSLPKAADLAVAERELRRKYPHIVEGSIRTHKDGPHKGRRTVEIVCQNKGCQNKRRIHTSDAFQVELCTECTKTIRQQRRAKTNNKKAK